MLPYGLKVPAPYFPFAPTGSLTQAHLSTLDFQNTQLNDYNVRVQLGLRNYQNSLGLSPFHAYITDPYTQAYFYKHDPRARFVQEEPKPSHSYIGLIGMAILNSKDKKLVLSDIYQWILDNYPYFRTRGPGWRNSIRHNLSLNDCFIKSGRSANGKGHYWAVHPANVDDFERGDFRRRRAQRKVRRHMGLSVPDDDDSPTASPIPRWSHHDATQESERSQLDSLVSPDDHVLTPISPGCEHDQLLLLHQTPKYGNVHVQPRKQSRKRLFDMASLLAPDEDEHDSKSDQQPSDHDIHISHADLYHSRERKQEDPQLTTISDNSKDKHETNTNEDVDITVSHLSSESERELDASDDDCVQSDIQVTSGNESPEHELHRHDDDKDNGQSLSSIYVNKLNMTTTNGGKIYPQRYDHKLLKWSSSLYTVSPKADVVHNKDTAGENVNSFNDLKVASNSPIVKQSKTNNHSNHFQKVMCQLSHPDPSELPEELSSMATGALEHMNRTAEEYHFYRSDLHGSHQKTNQENGYALVSTKDNGLLSHNRHNQTETTRSFCDTPTSDRRLSSDHLTWLEMNNSLLPRDRLCAFSAVGMRNSSIYSPNEFRTAQLSSQRFQPISTSVSAEVATSLISTSVSSPSSSTTSTSHELDTAVTKSCHQVTRSGIPDSVVSRLET
ncbi:unnamed protein product [Candidula unifasciata]|uniref:Fork-head domain-containing protein n=1 Tax=Candidula unifasciata TaxID=100452 RepID=A0A8S3ZYD3_9EUPU|nr:unnamed protein product [Candidula unifasciata]